MRTHGGWNRGWPPLAALIVAAWFGLAPSTGVRAEGAADIRAALERAGDNRREIEEALESVPADQRDGLEFLVANMPDRDLRGLTADFLLENCDLAYKAWRHAPWRDRVPVDVFHDAVLPYANVNERRDDWRREFAERFAPLVADAKSPGAAATTLNRKVFDELKVKYSTARPKADQSPLESMEAGLASCSGLAVLLVDACRAVGAPARFVGTPRWSDDSGNHSWVEVWDDGWHFTGAAEPAGDALDEAWFIDRASTARRDHPLHAIYAVSFRRTPLAFPLVWDPRIDYVHAVNVTDRYAGRALPPAPGERRVMFRVLADRPARRVAARLTIRGTDGREVFAGETKDERFDANDHCPVSLKDRQTYEAAAEWNGQTSTVRFEVAADRPLVTITLAAPASGADE